MRVNDMKLETEQKLKIVDFLMNVRMDNRHLDKITKSRDRNSRSYALRNIKKIGMNKLHFSLVPNGLIYTKKGVVLYILNKDERMNEVITKTINILMKGHRA